MADRPASTRVRRLGRDAFALAFVALATWAGWVRFSTAGTEIPGRIPFHLSADYFNYYIPMTEAVGARMRAGQLPLWNPEACSGMPLLATLQTAVLYPATWLAAAIPAHVLLPWLGVLQCVLGGVFAFALFRSWGCPRTAGAAGAAVFVFSCCIGQTLWPPAIATICWLPWLLLAAERIARGGGWGWWIGLAAGAALQALAGFPQFLIYGYGVLLPVVGLRLAHAHHTAELPAVRAVRRGVMIASAVLVGLGLAGAQLLPAAELVHESARSERLTPEQVHYLHPADRFTGSGRVLANMLDGTPGRLTFGEPTSGYVGSAALLFVAMVLVRRRREPLPWLLLALATASLLLSDGYLGFWPELYAAFAKLPVVGSLRTPERLRLVTGFCLAGLAALGLASLQQLPAEPSARRRAAQVLVGSAVLLAAGAVLVLEGQAVRRSLLALGLSLALCLALARSRRIRTRRVVSSLLLAWLAVDLAAATATRATLRSIPDAWVGRYRDGKHVLSPESLKRLRIAQGSGRLDLGSLLPFTGGGKTGGIRRITCYEPLAPAQWVRLDERLGAHRDGGITLAGVRGPAAALLEDLGSVRGTLVLAEGHFHLQENRDALPRAYFLGRSRIASADEALAAIVGARLAPRRETLVEWDPGATGRPAPDQPVAAPIPARIREDRAERVVADVEAPGPGLLVLTDSYYPGWQARVDGDAVPILRANGVHQAVAIDGGRHRVVFEYRPASFRRGVLLSGVSALVVLGVAVTGLARQRRSPGS